MKSWNGGFAAGLKDTVEMLTGPVPSCRVVSLLPGMTPENFDKKLEKAVRDVDSGEGVILFTDIASGTPYNRAVGLKHRGYNIEILSGANVPMVLEAALGMEGDKTEYASAAIENGISGISRVEFRTLEDDDDDF